MYELHVIDVLRYFLSVCDSWEYNKNIGAEDMAMHLEKLIVVVNGTSEFHTFDQ